MTAHPQETPSATIAPETQIGLVSLAVADLNRSLTYYTQALGFVVLDQQEKHATLGVPGTPLLFLTEETGVKPFPHDRYGYTGLYHFAILLPSRADLGRWLGHWQTLSLPFPGQGDHLVSEAFYITDPDGNGIEVYRDRPRAEWPYINGQLQMAADPIDVQGVLAAAEREGKPWSGFPVGTRLGHMHLQVGDIPQAETFYHEVLGFDVIVRMPSALFISAGGYHHHIGMNTWHSLHAGPAPAGIAGLRSFTIEMPNQEARDAVLARVRAAGYAATETGDFATFQDPWRNTICLTLGPVAVAQVATELTRVAVGSEAQPR
jgi:catechol 2,3-dioxygenase